jgi:hypothetical protein
VMHFRLVSLPVGTFRYVNVDPPRPAANHPHVVACRRHPRAHSAERSRCGARLASPRSAQPSAPEITFNRPPRPDAHSAARAFFNASLEYKFGSFADSLIETRGQRSESNQSNVARSPAAALRSAVYKPSLNCSNIGRKIADAFSGSPRAASSAAKSTAIRSSQARVP